MIKFSDVTKRMYLNNSKENYIDMDKLGFVFCFLSNPISSDSTCSQMTVEGNKDIQFFYNMFSNLLKNIDDNLQCFLLANMMKMVADEWLEEHDLK